MYSGTQHVGIIYSISKSVNHKSRSINLEIFYEYLRIRATQNHVLYVMESDFITLRNVFIFVKCMYIFRSMCRSWFYYLNVTFLSNTADQCTFERTWNKSLFIQPNVSATFPGDESACASFCQGYWKDNEECWHYEYNSTDGLCSLGVSEFRQFILNIEDATNTSTDTVIAEKICFEGMIIMHYYNINILGRQMSNKITRNSYLTHDSV